MKPVHLRYLLLAAFIGFFITRVAVHFCHSLERAFTVELASAVILGFALAIGLFFSLKMGFFDRGWGTILTGGGFLVLYGFIVLSFQIEEVQILQTLDLSRRLNNDQATDFANFYDKVSQRGMETKPLIVRAIYTQSGLKPPVQNEDGKIVVFQPSTKDKADLELTKEANAAVASFEQRTSANIQKLHWLSLIYTSTFLLVFLIGLLSIGKRALGPMRES